jgi:hypothetical protein
MCEAFIPQREKAGGCDPQDDEARWRAWGEERRRDRWADALNSVVWIICAVIVIAVLLWAGIYAFDHIVHVVRGY